MSLTPGALVIARNPCNPLEREVIDIASLTSLADLAESRGLDPTLAPTICRLNGRYVLQRDWAFTQVSPEDLVVFQVVPMGGPGGKNILASVLTIATLVLAGPIGGALAGSLGFAAGGFASAAITAALALGGTLLINSLIPPQLASDPARLAPSPTYTLAARNNVSRLGGPIPVVYGRTLVYPNLGATPYTEYIDNEQYLYLLLVIGQGEYDIGDFRIGETLASNFAGIEVEVVNPGETLSLFNPNAYTAQEVTGQTLKAPNENGAADYFVGPFIAGPPDAVTAFIAVDILFPRGFYGIDGSGDPIEQEASFIVEGRIIDENGIVQSGWTEIADETFNATSTVPLRVTFSYTAPVAARWEIRIHRSSDKDTNYKVAHDLAWGGLRTFLVGPLTFGDVTCIAVKAKASDNLNSRTAGKFNAIVQRKLAAWDGSDWLPVTGSRSIAWALADVLSNADYGAGLDDSRIDLDGLLQLEAIWSPRGDSFDGVFDQSTTIWDAITKIARAGRAVPYVQGGMVRFSRDQLQTLPVAMFTVSNIVLDSLSMDFIMPVDGQSADGVTGEYFDERTWLPASVTKGVDAATPENPAREQLFGVVRPEQAARETEYMAAANRYRRAFITFRTELEGLIPSIGDAILVAHDLPRWGLSGSVVAWDAETLTFTLEQEVELDPHQINTVVLRAKTGAVSASVLISPGASARQIVLANAPLTQAGNAFEVVTSGTQEPTHYAIGRADATPKLCRVTAIVPQGNSIELRAVVEDERVHVN